MKINSCVPRSLTSSFPKLLSSSLKFRSAKLACFHTFLLLLNPDPLNTGLPLNYLPPVTHAESISHVKLSFMVEGASLCTLTGMQSASSSDVRSKCSGEPRIA